MYLYWPTTWGGPESMGQILPAAYVFCVNPWCASQAALSATLSSREHGQRNVSNKWRQWGQRPRSLTSGELAGGPRSNSRNELLLWCKRPNVKVQSLTRAGGFSVTDHCTKHKAIMTIFILHPLSQMNKSMAFSSAKRVVSNWILTSCQPHRITSGWSNTQQTFYLFSNVQLYPSLIYKLNSSTNMILIIWPIFQQARTFQASERKASNTRAWAGWASATISGTTVGRKDLFWWDEK